MNRRQILVPLKCGRDVCYDEYGDPEGAPVFFCHGWPSSRTLGLLADEAGCDAGVRIISPDRPGISRSAFEPKRKLLDWPPIVREMADGLGINQFRVMGISGGAPYAFATAWAMPDRVSAVAIVSGAPPITELKDRNGLWKLYRWMLAANEKFPRFSRAAFGLAQPFGIMGVPIRLRPLLLKFLHPCDAEVMREAALFNIFFESQRHAWGGSRGGVLADARMFAQPWGFRLEEIKVPVRIWHGKQDRSFSPEVAEYVAARLPNCELRIVDKTGHYSLPVRHMREILEDLHATGRSD